MLPTDDKDYSDYMEHLSNVILLLSLFSAFVFTAYIILISNLPDPTSITAQFTLWILSFFLAIFLYLLGFFVMIAALCCRTFPPLSKRITIVNWLFYGSTMTAMGITVILISVLWNLVYLALVQTAQGVVFSVATYLFIVKPAQEYRKSKSSG